MVIEVHCPIHQESTRLKVFTKRSPDTHNPHSSTDESEMNYRIRNLKNSNEQNSNFEN